MKTKSREKKETIATASEQSNVNKQVDRLVTLKFGGAWTGTLVGFNTSGISLIDFPGNPALDHWPARSCIRLDAKDVGREIVLLFDNGDPKQPIIIGLVELPQVSNAETLTTVDFPSIPSPQEIEMDGKNIELTAKETITLRCGEASITLNRDGKIVIRGVNVISHAGGVNRIRGGSIQLN